MNLLNKLFKIYTYKQVQLQLNNQREQQKHQVESLTTQCNNLKDKVSYLDKLVEEKNEVIEDIVKYNKELEDKLNQLNTSKQLFITKLSDVSTELSNLIEDYSSK